MLGYVFVYLLAAGVLFGFAAELVLYGLALDPSVGNQVDELQSLSYQEVDDRVRDRPASIDGAQRVDVFEVVVSVIVLLLAGAVMRLPGEIAGQLTDYRIREAAGEQVEQQVRGRMQSAGGLAMHGGMMAVSSRAGRLALGAGAVGTASARGYEWVQGAVRKVAGGG